jgi:hypothetical protein
MMMAGGGQTKAEAREGIIDMMSDINIKRGKAGLSGLMDAAGDVITAGSAVIPINAAGKLALIEKAMKPLSGAYRKALEASRKGNVEYANLDPLVKEQAKKYIQLGKESDKASFALGAGAPTTFSLGVANQLGKFKYQDEDKKASGGLTAYANGGALEQSFADPYENVLGSSTNPYPTEYIEDEEDLTIGDLRDPLAAATALLALDPRRKALSYLGSKAKGLFGAIKRRYKKDDIDLGPTGMPAGKIKVGKETYDPSKVTVPQTGIDLKKVIKDPLITVPAGLGTAYSISSLSDESVDTNNKNKTETDTERQLRLQKEEYEKQLAELRNKATGTAKPKKEIDYDLVGLGGLIMGARNMSELGTGLAGLAERRQAREDALLEGQAQQDYYRASADKVRAEIENLPLEQKFDILDNITETLKQAREGEIELTDERKLELNQASQLLTSQILALQGITANSLTGFNVNEALGPKIN